MGSDVRETNGKPTGGIQRRDSVERKKLSPNIEAPRECRRNKSIYQKEQRLAYYHYDLNRRGHPDGDRGGTVHRTASERYGESRPPVHDWKGRRRLG